MADEELEKIGDVPPDDVMMGKGTWKDMVMWMCKKCPYSSLSQDTVRQHYIDRHILKRAPPPEKPTQEAPTIIVVETPAVPRKRRKGRQPGSTTTRSKRRRKRDGENHSH